MMNSELQNDNFARLLICDYCVAAFVELKVNHNYVKTKIYFLREVPCKN